MGQLDDFLDSKPAAGKGIGRIDSFLGPEKRTALGEISNQFAGGVAVELPEQVGKALQYTGEPGDILHGIGTKIREYGESNAPGYEPNPDDHNVVTNALAAGARMIPQSVAPAALVGAGIAALPASLPAAAAVGAGALATGTMFGAAQGQDTYEKGIKAGLPVEQAKEAARINALIEGGGETLGTYVGGKFVTGAGGAIGRAVGRVLGKSERTAGQAALDVAKDTAVVKPWLKAIPGVAAVEVGTEIGQNAGEAAVEQGYGIDTKSPLEAGIEAIAPTLGMTALLTPFGLAGRGIRVRQIKARMDALADPGTDIERRMALADQIAAELEPADKTAAVAWRLNAAQKIAADQPITLDDAMLVVNQAATPPPQTGIPATPEPDVPDLSSQPAPPIQRDETGQSIHPEDVTAQVAAAQPDAGPLSKAAGIAATPVPDGPPTATEQARLNESLQGPMQDTLKQEQKALSELEAADARVQEQRQKESDAQRRAMLDAILENPEVKNPVGAYAAELKRAGFQGEFALPTKEELGIIKRRADVQAAIEAEQIQEATPDGTPNEMNVAALVPEKKAAGAAPARAPTIKLPDDLLPAAIAAKALGKDGPKAFHDATKRYTRDEAQRAQLRAAFKAFVPPSAETTQPAARPTTGPTSQRRGPLPQTAPTSAPSQSPAQPASKQPVPESPALPVSKSVLKTPSVPQGAPDVQAKPQPLPVEGQGLVAVAPKPSASDAVRPAGQGESSPNERPTTGVGGANTPNVRGDTASGAGTNQPTATPNAPVDSTGTAPGEKGTVDAAAHQSAASPKNDLPTPTEAQREAGNFKMGHATVAGLPITIEHPEGTSRKPGWQKLKAHYGYVKRSIGADKENFDVFIKPGTPENYDGPVFVVDQTDKAGKFDEHKGLIGYQNMMQARIGYAQNYPEGFKVGKITEMTAEKFKDWLANGDTSKPLAGSPQPVNAVVETPAAKSTESDALRSAHEAIIRGKSQTDTMQRRIIDAAAADAAKIRAGKADLTAKYANSLRSRADTIAKWDTKAADAVRVLADHIDSVRPKSQMEQNRAAKEKADAEKKAANKAAMDARREAARKPQPKGAAGIAQRQINAADKFVDSVVEQFGLTKDEAGKAWDHLLKNKLVKVDAVGGQYTLKDGRLWDGDVMRRAAAGEAAKVEPASRAGAVDLPALVKSLQNRNRDSVASAAQMQKIARDPNPKLLMAAPTMNDGAPVVSDLGGKGLIPASQIGNADTVTTGKREILIRYAVVEADTLSPSNFADGSRNPEYAANLDKITAINNGRTAALMQAYRDGTAGKYRAAIEGAQAVHGITRDTIAKMQAPVLVRVMDASEVTANIGDESNAGGTLALSAVEQARNDAARFDTGAVEYTDDGRSTDASIRGFVAAMPEAEQQQLAPNGKPTKQAVDRMMAATFHAAYENTELVELMAQSTDPEAKVVLGAMSRAAGAMAKLRGAGDLDIRPIVTAAAGKVVNAVRTGVSLAKFLQVNDMLEGSAEHVVASMFAQNSRSARTMGGYLTKLAETARAEADKAGIDMFGDAVPLRTREQIIQEVSDESQRQGNLEQQGGRQPDRGNDGQQANEPAGPGYTQPTQGQQQDFALAGQTSAEVAAAEKAKAAAEAKAAADAKAAEAKAKADAQRNDFTLTGSDRAADASGQDSLFQPKPAYNPNQQNLFDPYATAETRPGTTAAQKDLGREAFTDAERRIFGSRLRGVATLLGSRISKDFRANGGTTLVGQTVEGPQDLALIAQVLRDPRFETFRVFYVNAANEIVGERAYSSRLPGAVHVPNISAFNSAINGDMATHKAAGYWLLHNHPGGRATASGADRTLTDAIQLGSPGFVGHVIIDHNEYHRIMANGADDTMPMPGLNAKKLGDDNPEVPHPLLGRSIISAKHLVDVAKELQQKDGFVTIVATGGSSGTIGLIAEVPVSVFQSGGLRLAAAVRRATLQTGTGGYLFAITPNQAMLPEYRVLRESGLFGDVVSGNTGESLAESGRMRSRRQEPSRAQKRGGMSPTLPSWYARQDEAAYAPEALGNAAARPTTNSKGQPIHVKGVDNFWRWFAGSKTVDEQGRPIVMYHGAQRPDRIGNVFKRSRAQSGPMAFFTNSPELASGYAQGKPDTSLDRPDDYAGWFKYKIAGSRSTVNIDRAWYFLSNEERQRIAARLPHVANHTVEGDEMDGYRLGGKDEYGLSSEGHWDYEIKQARGNVLQAAKEIWLNGGTLFNSEEEFMQVLKLGGMNMQAVEFDHPHAAYSAIIPVYLNIKTPLVTTSIPQSVMDALEKSSKRQRARPQLGNDAWAKSARVASDWMAELKKDVADGKNSHAWTSIPDWVTKVLQDFGYDGIHDKSGKNSGEAHDVWIPFRETQVKSATGNKGTFDGAKNSTLASNADRAQSQGSNLDANLFIMAASSPSIKPLLEHIVLHSKSPLNKVIARALIKSGINPEVRVGNKYNENPADLPSNVSADRLSAMYTPTEDGRGKIALFNIMTAEHDILHEASHADLYAAVLKGGMAARQAQALYEHVKKFGTFDQDAYGLESIHEFLAEARSNPDFQAELRAIPAIHGMKVKNAWDWFVNIVRGILGLDKTAHNALSQTLEVASALSEEGRGINGGTAASFANRAQTFTKAFRDWFGKSAVVNPDGTPLVVYHGAPDARFVKEDGIFKTLGEKYGKDEPNKRAFWFAADRSTAATYAVDHRAFDYQNAESGVVAAYLSLQNPLIIDAGGKQWREAQARGKTSNVIEEARKGGHDGAIIRNVADRYNDNPGDATKRRGRGPATTDTFVVFNSNQIKSATGNSGNYDPTNPSILANAAAGRVQQAVTGMVAQAKGIFGAPPPTGTPAPGASFVNPDPSRLDSFIYTMQDKHIDTKRVQEAITAASGQIQDDIDVYLQETLFSGRAAKETKDFLDKELNPLFKEMAARKVEIPDFEKFLHARHAEERNIQIAKINPNLPDGGSGMDTADAKAYLAGLNMKQRADYNALAKMVDAINDGTRQALIDYGLESQATIAAWESAYQHYVPLQREDMEGGMGTGQGFSVKGQASKRATGSTRGVENIIGNIAMQRERAIVRGEKNVVSNALVGLAEANPNTDFWRVDQPPKIKYVDDRTGLVTEMVDPLYKSRENVVMARLPDANGNIIERSVIFNEHDERAARMAKALKNLDMDQLGELLGNVAKATRYFASVNTQYNPIFGVVNLTRDSQQAMFNLSTTPIAGKQLEVSKNILPALKGIYLDLRAMRQGNAPNSAWAQLFEEFQKEGGQTGFRDMFRNSQERADAIQRELNRVTEGKAKQFGRAIFDWLSDYNSAMENAVRLSAYKVAKDSGMTNQRAASLAKNLTVNFNRKGQIATQTGALYAFFNASAQGTARLLETLNGPMGRKIILGGITLGSLQALTLAAAGFDDDDPPDFVRERSLIIPVGGKRYITIPMPLGLHFIPNIGRISTEFALSGFKNPTKRVLELGNVFADAFNPVGSSGLSLQTIAPTIVDPLAALAENKDWTGKPIAREDFNALAPTPGHTRAKDTASAFSKAISKGLNYASGGTNYKPGLFSPTPDQLDFLIGQVTGGVGREVMKAEQTVSSAFTGEDLPTYKIPLVGRFYGNANQQASHGNAFYNNLKEINQHEAEVKGRRKAGEPIDAYLAENPEARLIMMANATERHVSQLRRRRRELMQQSADRETIKAIDTQISARMQAFNDRVKQVSASAR